MLIEIKKICIHLTDLVEYNEHNWISFFDYDIYNKWFMVVIQNIRVSCAFQETKLNFF